MQNDFEENPRVPRYTIQLVRETGFTYEGGPLRNAHDVARLLREFYSTADREMLVVVTADTKNKVIGMNVVSVGSISESVAHPREMLKLAILQNAASIFLAHNHPSGDPMPSEQDRKMWDRITQASAIMGIRALDSLVIGEHRYYSFSNGYDSPYEV